jgi:hypothetical protein
MVWLKEYEGLGIEVDEDGKFTALLKGRKVRFSQLRDLEERITQTKRPIRALHVPYPFGFNLPEHIQVVRIEADGKLRDEQQIVYDAYSRVYLHDDKASAQFLDLFRRNEELREEWETVAAGLTLLTYDVYCRLREEEKDGGGGRADIREGDSRPDSRDGQDAPGSTAIARD